LFSRPRPFETVEIPTKQRNRHARTPGPSEETAHRVRFAEKSPPKNPRSSRGTCQHLEHAKDAGVAFPRVSGQSCGGRKDVSVFGRTAAPSGRARLRAALELRLENDAKACLVGHDAAPRAKPSQALHREGSMGMQLLGGRREARRALDCELCAAPVAPNRCSLRRALAEIPQHVPSPSADTYACKPTLMTARSVPSKSRGRAREAHGLSAAARSVAVLQAIGLFTF
jgi:hypothetical protein